MADSWEEEYYRKAAENEDFLTRWIRGDTPKEEYYKFGGLGGIGGYIPQESKSRRGFSPVTDFIRGMTSEGRNIYRNEDRTGSSERLTGFDIGGREYLYPSIFGGKDLFEQEPDTNAGRDAAMDKIISIFRKNRGYDPETNIFYGTGFSSREKANAFAKERSKGHRKYQLSDLLDVIRGRQ